MPTRPSDTAGGGSWLDGCCTQDPFSSSRSFLHSICVHCVLIAFLFLLLFFLYVVEAGIVVLSFFVLFYCYIRFDIYCVLIRVLFISIYIYEPGVVLRSIIFIPTFIHAVEFIVFEFVLSLFSKTIYEVIYNLH